MYLMNRLVAKGALSLGLMLSATLACAQTLKVSAIPDESPTELARKFAPLGAYLEKETGLKVEYTPVTDYAAVVEGMATNKIDLAWLGGFTFVQAKIRTNGGVTPIVQRAEDAVFTSKFIVPFDSAAKTHPHAPPHHPRAYSPRRPSPDSRPHRRWPPPPRPYLWLRASYSPSRHPSLREG